MTGRMLKPSFIHAAGVLLLLGSFLLPAAPAHADPHALFYTAIGQRQLFFNVLAALDQADYVEPATGPLSRQQLTDKRNAEITAQAGARGTAAILENDPIVEKTNTTLSALLSRNVTLEGNDLWTTYLAHQYALDVARTAGAQDFVDHILCFLATGRKNCSDKAEQIAQRDLTTVKDPVDWASLPVTDGAIAALLTGTAEHEAEGTKKRDTNRNKEGYEVGYAANPSIGRLQVATKDASPGIKKAVERDIARAAWSFLPLSVSDDLYEGLEIADNGAVTIAMNPNDPNYGQWYRDTYAKHLLQDQALLESAAAGQAMIENIQDVVETEGSKAKLKLFTHWDAIDSVKLCENNVCTPTTEGDLQGIKDLGAAVIPIVELPVGVNVSASRAATQVLGDLNTNQADTLLNTTGDPGGDDKLLQTDHGTVAGIQSGQSLPNDVTAGTEQGRVLHAATGADSTTVLDDLSASLPRGTGIREFATYETRFATALDPENVGKTGCGCSVDETANAFGTFLSAQLKLLSHL